MIVRHKAESALKKKDGNSDIAIRCRVRLARNLEGEFFPEWADEMARERVFERVSSALQSVRPCFKVSKIESCKEPERKILCETHLVSQDLLNSKKGSGLAYAADGQACVMINEEDHLRIQGFAAGIELEKAWEIADQIDTDLEKHLDYACSAKLGYLTACPSNLGTGLRASVMLHLLGLRLLNEIDPVIRGLERLRLLVRGLCGEGSEAAGQIYQISNRATLGVDEPYIVKKVQRVCATVAHLEANARLRLLERAPLVLSDCLARSLSLLQSARLLTTAEALEFLSAIRLGAAMGLCARLQVESVDELILAMQPGHLQQALGTELSAEERDKERAFFLRRRVAGIKLKC